MHIRSALAVALSVAPMFASRLAHADANSPAASDASLETRRASVERAEEELRLRKREEDVAAEHRALDRRAAERDRHGFSHTGRIVFPNLAGLSVMNLNTLGGTAISGGGLVAFTSQSNIGPNGGMKGSSISFNPSVDVFVTEHFTLGGMATAARTESTSAQADPTSSLLVSGTSGYGVSVGPRVGRTFDVGPLTIWPTVSGSYRIDRTEYASNGRTVGRNLTRTVAAVLSVDVVFPIGRYLMFSVGPTLTYEHASTDPAANTVAMFASAEMDRIAGGVRANLGVTF